MLVAGGSGFIGSHIVQALLDQDALVRIPIHSRPITIKDSRIETVPADLTKPADCLAAMDMIDYVFHAAGAVGAAGVGDYQMMEGITTNLILTANILQAVWAKKVKKVIIFGSSTGYPAYRHAVKEDEMWLDDPHPSYLGYGWMRRYFEKLGEYVSRQSQCTVLVVRPSAVYGPGDNFTENTSHVIPALIKRAVNRENPYIVWGSGEEVRDFIHISDFARGCLLAMEKGTHFNPINIGAGKGCTVREIVDIIIEAAGHKEASIKFDSTKPVTIPFRMIDTENARLLLGFEPQISLEVGIRDTTQWYVNTLS